MTSAAGCAVRVSGLVKRYGNLVAVDGLDLQVTRGTCLGLLGPNGAGKTTTIKVLEGLLDPDGGEVEVLGRTWRGDAQGIRERIGVQLQETRLPDRLTVFEALRAFRSFYDEGPDPDEVIAIVGLEEKRDDRVARLSGGQHQRLALGCALVNRPELLFLDEPSTGLDPQARRRVWEIVENFKQAGGTVLLTTHYMDEAEKLADDLVIVDHGRVISRGTPAEIVAALGAESIVEVKPRERGRLDGLAGPEGLATIPGVKEVRVAAGGLVLSVTRLQEMLGALLSRLEREGIEIDDLHTHRPTLEDVFVSLTGRSLRDA